MKIKVYPENIVEYFYDSLTEEFSCTAIVKTEHGNMFVELKGKCEKYV